MEAMPFILEGPIGIKEQRRSTSDLISEHIETCQALKGAGYTIEEAGGAPVDAQYVCLIANATLTQERVLTAGTGIQITDGGAGLAVTIASTITQYTDALAKAACVSDAAYGADWNGVTDVAPSKNAVYDKIESLGSGAGLWTDAGTYLTPTSTRDVGLIGSERYKMVGGAYAITSGGTDFRIMSPSSTEIWGDSHGARNALWSYFDTNPSNYDTCGILMSIVQTSNAGQINKTGIHIKTYTQPDNGGDVSGILVVQSGGGGAITCYKLSEVLRPGGYTNYASSVQGALEVGTTDHSQAGLFMSGCQTWGAHSNAAECIWCRIDNSVSKGILVTPNNNTFDSRQAYCVGNISRNNSADTDRKFYVLLDGTIYTARKSLYGSFYNASPVDGDLWFDGTYFYVREGGITKRVTA